MFALRGQSVIVCKKLYTFITSYLKIIDKHPIGLPSHQPL